MGVLSLGRWRLDGCADAAKLLHDRDFFFIDALDAVAHGLLDEPNVADESGDAVGFERSRLVGAPHGAVHGDVAFDTAGTEYSGGDGGRDTCFVAGVTDGHAIALDHAGDGAQVELLVLGRVSGGGVHEDEVVFAEDLDCVVDFGVGAHAGGGDDGLAGLADVTEEMVVGEGC